MITLVSKAALLTLCVTLFLSPVSAFTLTFPKSTWVSCKPNVLRWSFDENDPEIFSVALFNENRTRLNGNYQIANSLPTRNGSAIVRPNCVDPASGYYLSFVNASKYAENQPQVYYTSPTFSIVAATQPIPVPDGMKLINNDTTLINSDGSSIVASIGDSSDTQVNSGSSSSENNLFKPAMAATPLSGASSPSQTTSASGTASKNDAPSVIMIPHVLTVTGFIVATVIHLVAY